MDSLSEVAPGSLWTVDNGLDASRDRVGSIGLALCRPLDATHTGVHALAFSSAITTSTVSETGQLSSLESFVGRYCVGPRKQRGESCIRRKGSELPQLSTLARGRCLDPHEDPHACLLYTSDAPTNREV